MDYSVYYRQIESAQDRVRLLEKERQGLEEFLAELNRAVGEFSAQLVRKRRAASKAQSLAYSRIASGFGRRFSALVGPSFQSRITDNFDAIRTEAQRAHTDIVHEIAEQQHIIAQLNLQIQQAKQKEARLEAQ